MFLLEKQRRENYQLFPIQKLGTGTSKKYTPYFSKTVHHAEDFLLERQPEKHIDFRLFRKLSSGVSKTHTER
jgi:hypothetical protein